jgi:CubicO group peptidase (beta-lactamase class C family)
MDFTPVTAYLGSLRAEFDVRCCDCIVLKDHKPIYRHLTGTANFEDTAPLTEHHLHDIFSASKVMTVIAVMQQVEQGKIDLDDPLSQYLPEFAQMQVVEDFDLTDFVASAKFVLGWPGKNDKLRPAEKPILLREMLSMAAGFSYNFASEDVLALLAVDPHATTREIVRAWAKSPLLYEPGTRYAYSYALDILAAVVEVTSGLRFADYMKQFVFSPAGAAELYYHIPAGEQARRVDLYSYDAAKKRYVVAKENPARISDHYDAGGAGIACTVEDYAKVLDALSNGGVAANGVRLLTEASIQEMRKNRLNEQQLADFHIGGKTEYGYGYGVRTLLDTAKSKSPFGEFGWDGAAGAYVLADPEHHLSIFYVQASPESGPAFATIHPHLRDLVYDAIL